MKAISLVFVMKVGTSVRLTYFAQNERSRQSCSIVTATKITFCHTEMLGN